MALSILKQKINKREYKNFREFVRDCALVSRRQQSSSVACATDSSLTDSTQCANLQSSQIAGLRRCARDQGRWLA